MKDIDLKKIRHVHMIGIGGIGMSALADILLPSGIRVSGSDLKHNRLVANLTKKGCRISMGHKKLYGCPDIVVRSFSVNDDNVEVIEAKKRCIPVVERSELLRAIINGRARSVSICGTHGKTTTTAMTALVLDKAGLDPTVLVGGEVDHFRGNARTGKSDIFVTETDESDGFIATLSPRYRVITNIEKDHMEHYGTMGNLLKTFKAFLANSDPQQILFHYDDDKNIARLKIFFKGTAFSYGFKRSSDFNARSLKISACSSEFVCYRKGKKLGKVRLNVPGRHNIANALAAIAVAVEFGIPFKRVCSLIGGFRGVKRRFEIQSRYAGITVVEDYAHHPTEIKTVIAMAQGLRPKRIIAIFQPHRFSRTRHLAGGFADAFYGADELILTDIYAAHERPLPGGGINALLGRIEKQGSQGRVMYIPKEKIARYIAVRAKGGDVVLVIGAGDINLIVPDIVRNIKGSRSLEGIAREYEPLAGHTSFRIGGPARFWAEPEDEHDLRAILEFASAKRLRVMVLGAGSNVLFSDRGFPGIVVRLSGPLFNGIVIKGTSVSAGAGVPLQRLIKEACRAGLCGLEGLSGIPGTVGGAVYMNAGYKITVGACVKKLRVMDKQGTVRILSRKDLTFGYRTSNLTPYIVLGAELKLKKAVGRDIEKLCSELIRHKKENQPLGKPSAGCVFKNPEGSSLSAGKLIDECGLKGKQCGGAEVSRKHANFIINTGQATSRDVQRLKSMIKRTVRARKGVLLEEELIVP
ncbi:MAG: UDP-N-acetylmuramate--L-alanine ligase [Candidatus Omnitrophica bacterium]|nr:UDP-N-acetylmuramate--L-alanine ligase [Candidatus Omnitrophota bacterium]